MQHVRLGRTGLPVSRLCLGTMTFGLQCNEPASVAILNMDEAGEIGAAAGMATLIVASSTTMCVIYAIVTRVLLSRTQAWRAAPRT